MERVTISLEEDLLAEFDAYIGRKAYTNRSEAIRDLLRRCLEQDRLEGDRAKHAVACLSYVYNHHQRELAQRLTKVQHGHHDLMLSTLHVHLNHEDCLEVVILRGHTEEVRRLGGEIVAETGVRHGYLHIVPADVKSARHRHGNESHEHVHTRPMT